eukprot:TRINITY_DN33416_c0_g1_i1.p1 TRINITY_DN33416_c0_g1~~TRINITY_DN33416_c0_g1_i1.p1  ORF type:complete len:135 (+),score=46.73 TRINITY_DN33416_c0_g1_i1:60-464(+)
MAEKKTAARREISKEELAKHKSADDCWISVHNLVLELPKDFLDEHPGGPDVITVLAGQDASNDFEDIAHSDSARTWSDKYIIGYLEGTPEEDRGKLVSEIKPSGGGDGAGGLGGMVPVVLVGVVAAVGAYFFTR